MNLNTIISQFFMTRSEVVNHRVSVVRHDGISLYSNISDEFEKSSIGALVAGLWQAADALKNLASSDKGSEFRLSFDTSADGFYILPMRVGDEDYFLCGIYAAEVNPGKLKKELRKMKYKLETVMNEKLGVAINYRDEFLFKNITDAEMDQLFGLEENVCHL